MIQTTNPTKRSLRPVTVLAGVILGIGVILSPVPEGVSPQAWKVLGVTLWMAFWWLTKALPIPVTALLPLIVFPVLGLFDFKTPVAPYAHPLIFLFMGGFIIAKAIETWNLHRRIALLIVRAFGTKPDYLIAGFMLATATLSMWVSNTATTVMMLPIAISLVNVLNDKENPVLAAFAQERLGIAPLELLIPVALAASCAFMMPVATPPNTIVFASEKLTVLQMTKAGFLLNLIAIYVIILATWTLVG